jgi:hypothetical protein
MKNQKEFGVDMLYYLIGIVQGLAIGYLWFAPENNFKRGFIDGLTMKFLWGKK